MELPEPFQVLPALDASLFPNLGHALNADPNLWLPMNLDATIQTLTDFCRPRNDPHDTDLRFREIIAYLFALTQD